MSQNKASNALRILSETGIVTSQRNAQSLSLVSKNVRQSGLNMINVIRVDCKKADCIDKLNTQLATFTRVKAVHIQATDAKSKTLFSVIEILKNRNINLQELHIALQKSHGLVNLSLPERLGEGLCKKIRIFRLYLGDRGKVQSGVNINFIEKFVNLDTLTLDEITLSKDAPKLPKLSNLYIATSSNFNHIISANRTSLKRLVLSENYEEPFASEGHNQNQNQRTRASSSADSMFNNLEFLQIVHSPREVSLTSILKHCPKLKTLITQDLGLVVGNADVTDKLAFLAMSTSIFREGLQEMGEDVVVHSGMVKIKGDQYIIKSLKLDEDLDKMTEKLNMH